jgi:putative ABC transport system permease protein
MFQSRLFARIISKNREVYLLKIITLAVAFASSALIILFAFNEFGYDRFHQDADAIFRIVQRNNREDFSGNRLSSKIPATVFSKISKSNADSLIASRVKILNDITVLSGSQIFHDQKLHAVDPSLLSVFSFHAVDGALESFQNKEQTVLLSEQAARQFFNTSKVSGKKLTIYTLHDTVALTVAAVFQDFPSNSHEQFDVLVRFDANTLQALHFDSNESGVYGKINNGTALEYETKLQSGELTYKLQPVPEIYFGPRVVGEEARHGDEYSIWILLCITGLILFLALTSYINLTTLTLPHRSKELAIKKLAGTNQATLVWAFAKESFALVGISLLVGVAIILATAHWIEPILSIDITQTLLLGNLQLIIILFALLFISGLAPLIMVFKFTRATPTRLLSTETISFPRFKRVITFLQLGISIFLIVASIVIRRQVNYSLLKEPGRNHYQVVYLNYPTDYTNEGLWELRAHWKRNNPNIQDVMATSQLPNHVQSKQLDSDLYFMTVDRGFFDFFDLKTQQGRTFQANDEAPLVVVNESSQLTTGNKIIGVIENMGERFNQPEKPIEYRIANQVNYNFLCVRILEVNIRRTVIYLSQFFTSPDAPLKINFMDKHFEEWLNYQDRLNKLSELLAIISGALSCLAIYGLSLSLVRDKIKQIALHKLFGASIPTITRLLVKEFVKQMGIAILIFGPFTYIFLKEFLRNFVYTTPFEWTDPVYPLSYCAIVILALCGFQAFSLNRSDLTGALKG